MELSKKQACLNVKILVFRHLDWSYLIMRPENSL